jgi:energy-coupling factor transporter ATP-binding protein EcfA2
MFPDTIPPEFPNDTVSTEMSVPSAEDNILFETLVAQLELKELLDLPMIALSNGQTRRARIVKAILRKPELLLLDEPLSTCCKFSIILVLIGVFSWLGCPESI